MAQQQRMQDTGNDALAAAQLGDSSSGTSMSLRGRMDGGRVLPISELSRPRVTPSSLDMATVHRVRRISREQGILGTGDWTQPVPPELVPAHRRDAVKHAVGMSRERDSLYQARFPLPGRSSAMSSSGDTERAREVLRSHQTAQAHLRKVRESLQLAQEQICCRVQTQEQAGSSSAAVSDDPDSPFARRGHNLLKRE